MCSKLHGCFPCRSEEGCSRCWSSFISRIRMRTRSESAGTVSLSGGYQPDQNGKTTGGKRFKIRNLWGGHRSQAQADVNTTVPDGRTSPKEDEPKIVVPTFEAILGAEDMQNLHEASQQLIVREERLFGGIMETDSLKNHKKEEDKLAEDYTNLKGLVLKTLRLSLSPGEVSVEALTSAVKAINQEVEQSQQWKKRNQQTPAWRQDDWKKLHDLTLRSLVEDRMDNPITPPADQEGKSSFQADVNSMGRQLKEDLLLVVKVVKRCYPPEEDICNFYAKLYHQMFSSRLRKIADFGLEDKDCTFLLRWVNEYYPEILQKPELSCEISAEVLGKLLPKELLEPLEEQYLSKQQDELKTYIVRVLDEAEQKWTKGEEPTMEDGCFVSHVAYDIIQLIHGMMSSAEKIMGDVHKAQIITCQLKDLMQSFQIFHNNIMKQNKPNSRQFIKANLCCIEQFMELLSKKRHLFQEDVRTKCLQVLAHMKESAHTYLLKPVHDVLKSKYSQLGTSEWLKKPATFEKLLDSIEKELQDLQGSVQSCHEALIGQLHREVTVEYVRRLLKGKVKLKDKEQQHSAYQTIKDNTDSFQDLFGKMGSKEDWLNEILTKIAEVVKLQELPSIQMEVVSLGTTFPDLSEKHVSALLKLKTNISRAERKMVKETLTDNRAEIDSVITRPFFNKIQVK
ncbi:tumor necrosis factor alpha-induced protein 2-like isoform X2 [Cheilinus undulatus]|uniref:tumor necrosis factor alpha-induced protein 2-like isoform X2 n=1 Tax=Cheilinus undulatus TaxID=241271 RepID=UPI001BD533A8|nr:tumor necrosis factor alpha-induced protein 2-like isoform X2 [Cheilinus undulatus]